MDDIALRMQNRNFTNDSPNVTYDDKWYHLTDTQFSTVAIIDSVGKLLERVSYTAGGEARHHHRGDLNGDGGTSSTELSTINTLGLFGGTAITSANYNPNADLDCSGTIDSRDYSLVSGLGAQAAVRRGQISGNWVAPSGGGAPSSTDNIVGYCGYLFNGECGLYSVRFRVYDPVTMRWLTRDPAGYVDGANLYEYVRGDPIGLIDPFGLENNQPWYWDAFDWTLDTAANLGAGIADNLTFGGTSALRSATGVDDSNGISGANPDSAIYQVGDWGTTAATIVTPKGWVTIGNKAVAIGKGIGKADEVVTVVKTIVAATDTTKAAATVVDAAADASKKAAQLKANYKTGILAEEEVVALLMAEGFEVVARHISVITPFGRRVVDIVIKVGDEFQAIEVKAGDAIRDLTQQAKDLFINKFGAKAVGKKAERANIGEITKTTTIHAPTQCPVP